jgi:hypothetical protein
MPQAKQIIVSSELLSNYKASSIMSMSKDQSFSALQTTESHALLFSIGTDGKAYLTQESPGRGTAAVAGNWSDADLKAGWRNIDLSGALAASGVTGVKRIAVAQNIATSNIHIGLAASTSGDDLLHLSRDNSASDASWVGTNNQDSSTSWAGASSLTPYPIDDPQRPSGKLSIVNVQISEASGTGGEFIIVDVLRQAGSGDQTILRYFIDPDMSAGTGQIWNQHAVGADLSDVSSALGQRPQDGGVDGIYTKGSNAGGSVVTFVPLYTPPIPGLPPIAPNPNNFTLPGGAEPSAMATVRRSDLPLCTDLFVASGNTIYFFDATTNQQDGAIGVAVFSDPLVTNVGQLYGYRKKNDDNTDDVVLWGLSAAADDTHSVFYLTCPSASILTATAWSKPLPLLDGVHGISPFANKANNANNFFAQTGDSTLRRAMQAPHTSIWNHHDIQLQPPPNTKAQRHAAFTTRVQINDEKGQRLTKKMTVQISAAHRVGVDINGFYQVLDTAPISVETDATGALNIIEWVTTPQGTQLTVTVNYADGSSAKQSVNPMTNMLKKATKLITPDNPKGVDTITPDALSKISVPNRDGTSSGKPLIPAGTDPTDVATAASALNQLALVHASLSAGDSTQPASTIAVAIGSRRTIQVGQIHTIGRRSGGAMAADFSVGGLLGSIEMLAGDLFSSLENTVNKAEYSVSIVEDAATKAWHFVATIGEEVYSCVLDAVEKVAGAVMAVYNAIKAFIEDLIAWLEFLLEWHDFVRSKRVCKKLMWMGLHYVQDNADGIKTDVDNLFATARNKVADWSGDSGAGNVDNSGNPPGFVSALFDVSAAFTSPAMYFYNHFLEGVLGGPDAGSDMSGAFDALDNALDNSADTMVAAVGNLQDVIVNFQGQNVEDTVKQIAGVVAEAFLNGTDDVFDALFDVFKNVLQAAGDSLDQPIRIPIISDIIEDVFRSSLDFTWLDFILMCGAIPGTLLCKSIKGGMPFKNSFGDAVLDDNTTTLEDLLGKLHQAKATTATRAFAEVRMLDSGNDQGNSGNGGSSTLNDLTAANLQSDTIEELFIVCHAVAGVAFLVKSYVAPMIPDDSARTQIVVASAAASTVAGVALAASAMLAAPNPLENQTFAMMQRVAGLASLAVGLLKLVGPPYYPSLVDAFVRVFQLVCTSYHLHELQGEPDSKGRRTAYIDEVNTICICLAILAEDGYLIAKDPDTKAACLSVMTTAYTYASCIEFANAAAVAAS